MRRSLIYKAWARILMGYRPVLSIEVTNMCPLSCPGCYAYTPGHVSGLPLERIPDKKGHALVASILEVIEKKRPLGLYLVGGEPLVRKNELNNLLPEVCRRGIEVEVVTSGIIEVPATWKSLAGLNVAVSVDGLQPDHDSRRRPATYERILRNIEEASVIIHCTVTSQMLERREAVRRFVEFWSSKPNVRDIRMSLYTPQIGEVSPEMLTPRKREETVAQFQILYKEFPKLRMSQDMLDAYLSPPVKPGQCIFAMVTECLSADLQTVVSPCQLGGNPDCSACGCVAAVGLSAVGAYRFPFGISVGRIFGVSEWIGKKVKKLKVAERHQLRGGRPLSEDKDPGVL